ncbi:MAG: hypothetical protein ACRYGF_11325 [Janthinobacterium lividum]
MKHHLTTCLSLSLLAPALAWAGSGDWPPVHESHTANELLAVAEVPTIPLGAPLAFAPFAIEMFDSAALPSLPEAAALPPLHYDAVSTQSGSSEKMGDNRFSVIPAGSAMSMRSVMQSTPLAAPARYIHAQRFNTEDGSSLEAFTICYRLSNRSSVQVIPGDPAPVKIPVTSMANNMGVTVGMVLRLSKTH